MRICSGPGCGRAIPEEARYCSDCQPGTAGDGDGIRVHRPEGATSRPGLRLSGAQRAASDPILAQYSTPRWGKLKQIVLQRYPFCVECKRNPSRVADHEIPARLIVTAFRSEQLSLDPWGGFYVMENLRGRCHSCHNSKSKIEDTQDWSAELESLLSKFRKRVS